MKTNKRFLALCLALLLACAVLPAPAAQGADVQPVLSAALAQQAAAVPSPGYGDEWTVLGLARGGYFAVDSDYFARYYADVASKAPELTAASGRDGALNAYKSTDNSRVILALSAIGRDAAKTFDRLARGETVGETEALWLAPEGYKPQLLAHIEAQTRLGPKGYIGIKVNSMNDADVMARLVRASEAGTEVELFVRGICCLRAGVPDETDNIHIISIVGRYLEHSRIYILGRGERARYYIGSADWMTRSTLRRVEIAAPVTAPALKARLQHIFNTMLADNSNARVQQPDGSYVRRMPGADAVDCQAQFYEEAYQANVHSDLK